MELPKKVRIAGRDIQVIDWNHKEADAYRAYSLFSKQENSIKIDTSHDNIVVMETFIHELLHAIYCCYCIDGEDNEERTVSMMSVGLTQVLRDNQELLGMFNDAVAIG